MGARSRTRAERRAVPAPAAPPEQDARRRHWRAGAVLVGLALVMRVLFWQATPDRGWAYSAWYKGDAPVWMDYARALQAGQDFELGLPIHPPAAGYLVEALWNGRPAGLPWLRLCWVVMGALLVGLVFVALLRSFGFRVAAVAGFLCAVSTGLMVLGSSVNNEVPYLLLAIGALALFEDVRAGGSRLALVAFSALHGAACLFRVEHALTYALLLGLLLWAWRGAAWPVWAGRVGLSLAACLLPLVPWHVTAWRGIERFNEGPRVFERGEDLAIGQVERALAGITWQPDAEAQREALPAFLRRTTSVFVAATVAYRGGEEVRGQDFAILYEAFGYAPRPVARHPFVSSYGPLNFYLANRRGAPGGFDRSPLQEPPPLHGGPQRYPAFLVAGLPPPNLTFVYPPHLRLFNDGYRLGFREMRADPSAWLSLAARKLRLFWSGAALGLGGFDLPLGLSGLRRAVDLVVPVGPLAGAWSLLVLAACALGVVAGWKQPALLPWLVFLASKVVVTLLFFGYARQGAMMVPVVALLAALALVRWGGALVDRIPGPRRTLLVALALALPVAVEIARFASRPAVTIDGQAIGPADPFPADEHRDQAVLVR
jgi:hypothetical protein